MLRIRRLLLAVLATLACAFISAPAWGAITITIQSPTAGQVVGLSLNVSVTVSSTYQLQKVHAQVETVGMDLSPGASSSAPWTGTLDVGALSRASKMLTITATDLFNNSNFATVSFMHDNPPVITVTSPIDGTVATPNAQLTAACTDDDTAVGCKNFQAQIGSTVVASGTSSINQSVSLAASEGQKVTLSFQARDSSNSLSIVNRLVYIDSSSGLVPIDTVNGVVLDFDAGRLLFRAPDGKVVLRDLLTKAETQLGTSGNNSSIEEPKGLLTSSGAAWTSMNGVTPGFGDLMAAYALSGAGTYKFYDGSTFPIEWRGDHALIAPSTLVDLTALTTTQITWPDFIFYDDAGVPLVQGGVAWTGLAPTGDVFGLGQQPTSPWDFSCPVLRYHNGTISTIGSIDACPSPTGSAVSDGVNVVFTVTTTVGPKTLMVDLGGTVTVLAEGSSYATYGAYAAAGGWVAYPKKSSGNIVQVWTRSPSGTETQVSPFNTDSSLDSLGGNGELMFTNWTSGVGSRRWFGIAGSPPTDVSSALGRAVWKCGGWYVIMGNTVFKVVGVGADGGGCSLVDAGAPDSSVDGSVDAGSGGSGGTLPTGGAGGVAGGGSGGASATGGDTSGGSGGTSTTGGAAGVAGSSSGGTSGSGAVDSGGASGSAADASIATGGSPTGDAGNVGGQKSSAEDGSSGCATTRRTPFPTDALVGVVLALTFARRLRQRRDRKHARRPESGC